MLLDQYFIEKINNTVSYVPNIKISNIHLIKIAIICLINIIFIFFIIINAPIEKRNNDPNNQTLQVISMIFDKLQIYSLLKDHKLNIIQMYFKNNPYMYILLILIYIVVYIYIIRKFNIDIMISIYENSILVNRNYINSKYNLQNKSLLTSNELKDKMINNIHRYYNILQLIIESIILSILLCFILKFEYLIQLFIFIPVILLIIYNSYNKILTNYINLVIIILSIFLELNYIILISLIYLFNIYSMYTYSIPNANLLVDQKYYGKEIIDIVHTITINNIVENNKIYVFKPGNIYMLKNNNTNFLEKISNKYYHNEEFFINDVKYLHINPYFWNNIILLEPTFKISKIHSSIKDYIYYKTKNTNIDDIYNKIQCTIPLSDKLDWYILTQDEKYQIMLLLTLCSKSFIILIPDFIFDNINNQKEILEYLKSTNTINIIESNKLEYKN